MKLLKVAINNFRLLKDVDIEFSCDAMKNLTVIRAANESGKTTFLTALQWALFGESALPNRGQNFRLSPLDCSKTKDATIEVSVEVDYAIKSPRSGELRKYKLIRSTSEYINEGNWKRNEPILALFKLTSSGIERIEYPEAHIRTDLPTDLREVFFTDGDRALSFIEGSRGEQSKRVEAAIRSLLGLSILEDTLSHLRSINTDLNKKVRTINASQSDLLPISEQITTLQIQLPELTTELQKIKEKSINLDNLIMDYDNKISAALRNGNRSDLENERKNARNARERAERETNDATRKQADLFRSDLIARHLLSIPFEAASKILNDLRDRGKIPNQTIPVLEDRLNSPVCICGESLDPNDSAGQLRRRNIMKLIEESREADALQEKITELYYGSQSLLAPIQQKAWIERYNEIFKLRNESRYRAIEAGEKESELEAKISKLPNIDIADLQSTRDKFRKDARDYQIRGAKLEVQIENCRKEMAALIEKRDKLLKHDERGLKLASELDVTGDLIDVIEKALSSIKTLELKNVSERMNSIFLEMIGADNNQRAIITEASITSDFRIMVMGQAGQELDPSTDLNGASRRALTIAFILALTTVSEVEAPNVIDTPLGMMSGYVKQAVLQLASRESSQLILFLTHAEISGCEEIISQRAGKIYTLTNPAHYPKILVNRPEVQDSRILVCNCDHLSFCNICQRKENILFDDLDHVEVVR